MKTVMKIERKDSFIYANSENICPSWTLPLGFSNEFNRPSSVFIPPFIPLSGYLMA